MLIDNFASNWLHELDAAFYARPKGAVMHLLIDGAFVPGLHQKVAHSDPYMLFEGLPGYNEATRSVSPFVVTYDHDDRKLRKMLEACSGWPMVSAITTTESAAELAQRLSPWCVVKADGQYLNFRFPDTRRLPDILGILDAKQFAEFTGMAMGWRYIGRAGEWANVSLSPCQSLPAIEPQLETSQFSKLVASSDIDVMLAQTMNIGCKPKSPLKSKQYEITESAINIAIKNKVQDDMLFWCIFCLESVSVADARILEELFVVWAAEELSLAQERIEV